MTKGAVTFLSGRNGPVWLVVAALACVLPLALKTLAPPAPLGPDAPPEQFAAARAEQVLRFLLGDELPHPVGSAANRAVRDRLLETLRGMELDVSVQSSVGCSARWPVCANVENVLALIPGKTSDVIVLMAHYDSVPHAPGAADDGAGVAALIETARVLLRSPAGRNRVLLLFTDAEEVGLLGAEAFFSQHPLAADVRAVINLEGSGSGGPALLLRTTRDGGRLLRTFQQYAPHPAALSMAQEVFERMPNDTDFSVAQRAAVPGIDFAFAFEFNHYHTPLDTIANLDKGSLQHHGDNLLPLVTGLRNADLGRTEPNYVYLTPAQSFWITWPAGFSVPLALLTLLLLAATGYRLRDTAGVGRTLGSAMLAALALLLGLVVCAGALWVSAQLNGTTVKFPASFWPYRLIMYASAALPVCLLGAWAYRRLSFWPLFLGVWWLLGLLGLLLAVAAPLASNLLLAPVTVTAVGAFVIAFCGAGDVVRIRLLLAVVSSAALGLTMLTLSYANEQTQGLTLAPAIYAGLVILATTLLPLRPGLSVSGLAAAVLIAGLIWSANAPLYSAWRPQHVSLHYVIDQDQRRAHWAALSPNPLPPALLEILGDGVAEDLPLPWASQPATIAPAAFVDLEPVEVDVRRDGGGVELTVRSRSAGDFVGVAVPVSAGISNLRLGDMPLSVNGRGDYLLFGLYAAGQSSLRFRFDTADTEPVLGYVVDIGNTLPVFARELRAARGELAVPQHRGDQRIAFRRVKF